MRTQIQDQVCFGVLSVRIDKFLELWATSRTGRSLKTLPFKRDLTGWNTGPTSMQPLKTVGCYVSTRYGDACIGVYEIWERSDGFSMKCYKFDDIEDYEAYNPSTDSPDAIHREIGLCTNYHKGV